MGRFAKLELHNPGPEDAPGLDETPVEEFTEEHYLKAARRDFDRGEYESALRRYSRALQLNINLQEAWAGQVRALLDLGEYTEAQIWADKALERFRDAPDLLAAKAVGHAREGRRQEAMAYSDAAISAGPETQYVWLSRGECLLLEENRNARFCFMKALENAPGDWRARAYIGAAYLRRGYAVDAIRYFTEATAIDQEEPMVWLHLGRAAEALGHFGRARTAYGEALALDPGSRRAKAALRAVERVGLGRRIGSALSRWALTPRTFERSTPARETRGLD